MQPSSTIRYGVVLVLGIRHGCSSIRGSRRSCVAVLPPLELATPSTSSSRRASTSAFGRWRRRSSALAARLDGDGDVRPEPRDQRGHRRRSADLNTMIVILGALVTLLHDARRHSGGDLERRDPVLHHVRRTGRDGRGSRVTCPAASPSLAVNAAGGEDALVAAARRRRRGAASARAQFLRAPIDIIASVVAIVVGRDGRVHERPGDGAAAADDAVAQGCAVGVHRQCRGRCAMDVRPVVRRLRAVCVFPASPAAAGVRDRQAPAVFHVAGVSGRRGRPRHRRDSRGVAVEHRLGDQLVHVGGGRRFLQPPDARRRRAAAERRDGARCWLSRMATVVFGAAGHRPGVQRARSGRCWRFNQAGQRLHRTRCSASSCSRCSAAAPAALPRSSPASSARSPATTWRISTASASCGRRRSASRRRCSSDGR